MKKASRALPLILILGLIAWRFLHFGAELDLPHDWRQADTAYYIWDFYQNGIDLLHPAVCWMGASDTVILEFPLPEAIVAQVQSWFGESMWLSRLVFLLFFLLCTYYFYRIVELLLDEQTALWATVIYLALPLAQFYSRAIHIDFFAQAFAYATFYYAMLGVKNRAVIQLILSASCAAVALLVKAPYLFFLALPVLVFAYHAQALSWVLKHSLVYLPSLLAFVFWQQHVYAINSAAPDWDYILHYRKFDQNASWYFGVFEQRLRLYFWKEIGLRIILEAGALIPVLLLPWFWLREKEKASIHVLAGWVVGLGIYVLLFFNLNVFHNYYQIPFLGPVAIFTALALRELRKRFGNPIFVGVLSFCIIVCTAFAEQKYYQLAPELDEVGAEIRKVLPPTALPIIVYQDFDCRNPRILYRARRRGWSLEEEAANPNVVQRLIEEAGATHLVVFKGSSQATNLLSETPTHRIKSARTIRTASNKSRIVVVEVSSE